MPGALYGSEEFNLSMLLFGEGKGEEDAKKRIFRFLQRPGSLTEAEEDQALRSRIRPGGLSFPHVRDCPLTWQAVPFRQNGVLFDVSSL
jgi:hypothetical protein